MVGAALLFASQANAARIEIRGSSGAPGDQALVDVVLVTSQGEEVAGTQNDITLNPTVVSLAAASACVINPAIGDRAEGCEEDPQVPPCKQLNRALDDVDGLRRFRGLILSLANTNAINDSSGDDEVLLYTCTFQISSEAELNVDYLLTCSNQGASDPAGVAIDTECMDGAIRVELQATPTPTATVTTAATNTPTTGVTATATTRPTDTRPPTGDNDDDGCQAVAPVSSHTGWLLFAPAALLLWSRRRSR
jgi:hypothetical protein